MSAGFSIVLYITLFLLSALILHNGMKRRSKALICIGLSIPILLGSLRYGVGTDYFGYVNIYERFSSLNFNDFFSNSSSESMEIGFFILIKLSAIITGNYVFMFTASSFLTILFFYLGLARLPIQHKALAYLLYLLMLFPFTFNAVRQGIAISITFYALTFVIEKKLLKFSLWLFIAGLFHTSALLLYPLYFLNRMIKKYRRNTDFNISLRLVGIVALLLIITPLLFRWTISQGLFQRYDIYQSVTGSESSYDFLFRLLTLGIILLFIRRLIAKKNKILIYFFLTLTVVDLALSTIGLNSTFIARIGLYLTPFSYVLLAQIIDVFEGKRSKDIARYGIISFGLIYFGLTYYYFRQSEVLPYNLISFGALW